MKRFAIQMQCSKVVHGSALLFVLVDPPLHGKVRHTTAAKHGSRVFRARVGRRLSEDVGAPARLGPLGGTWRATPTWSLSARLCPISLLPVGRRLDVVLATQSARTCFCLGGSTPGFSTRLFCGFIPAKSCPILARWNKLATHLLALVLKSGC